MEVSGEVADLLVREGLQVAEVAAKLAGKGAVNAAVLLAALAQQNYRIVGKVGIERLLKDNAESVVIPVMEADRDRYERLAKQFGVLYALVQSEETPSGVLHVVSTANYSAQLNAVMEAMGYAVPGLGKEEAAAKKAQARAPRERSSDERGTGLNRQRTDTTSEKPSTRKRLAALDAAAREMAGKAPVRQTEKTR